MKIGEKFLIKRGEDVFLRSTCNTQRSFTAHEEDRTGIQQASLSWDVNP